MPGLRRRLEERRSLPNDLRRGPLLWMLIFGVLIASHAGDLIDHGLDTYAWAPRPLEILLLALAPLDLAIVLLIAAFQRLGLVLGAAALLAECSVSWWAFFDDHGPARPTLGAPVLTAFTLAILMSTPWMWSALPRARKTLAEKHLPDDDRVTVG